MEGGPSMYNNNKGIKATIIFTPLPEENPSKKHRANAKPVTISKITHFHKDVGIKEFIVKVLQTIHWEELIEFSWLYRAGEEMEQADSFSAAYSIPQRVVEPITINDEEDFKQMVEEATKKANAEVKIMITENKVCLASFLLRLLFMSLYRLFYEVRLKKTSLRVMTMTLRLQRRRYVCSLITATAAPDAIQTQEPSPEEVAQATIIRDLEWRHICEDCACSKTPCYIAGPEAEHVHLMHMHLRTWVSAIVACIHSL